MKRVSTALAMLLGSLAPASAQNAPALEPPIACGFGVDCFIQQYADHDPGVGAEDYRCGIATYNGHDGTDFRVLSTKAAAKGVPVLASAAGRVKAVRDGVEDRLVETPEDRARVENRECGNGVVIDHGNGWETQYCHMLRGSVQVREGQSVETGAALGLVGYSGMAQFAHVHLSVRHNGTSIDPFLGDEVKAHCVAGDSEPAAALWTQEARETLKYQDGVIIETGFSSKPVKTSEAEQGDIAVVSPSAPTLVFYGRVINLRAGDKLRLSLVGPGGFRTESDTEPLDRNKAQYIAFVGKSRPGERWPAGLYKGSAEVIRAGATIRQAANEFQMP